MTASIDTGVQELGRQHPEWQPWLAVVQEVLSETANAKWEAFVPALSDAQEDRVPLLSGATLALEMRSLRPWTERLMRAAVRSGAPKMAALEPATNPSFDIFILFKAALCHDGHRLQETAIDLGVDTDALQAVAALLPMPFLHACHRLWASSRYESWTEGYCPICGAWPALVEVRGIERSRYLRCGRCGSAWQVHCLFCPFCGMTDHEKLVSLIPESDGSTRVIEACTRCLGYVKCFTVLQGSPPAKVMIDDLGSVELDIAALHEGYKRPEGSGYALHVTMIEKHSSARSFLRWRS